MAQDVTQVWNQQAYLGWTEHPPECGIGYDRKVAVACRLKYPGARRGGAANK
jgi:hypothetical protein